MRFCDKHLYSMNKERSFHSAYMVIMQNDSNGLFRATHSHNPPEYSHSRVASSHFMLISGRAIKLSPTYVS